MFSRASDDNVDWRLLLHLDTKAVAVLAGCALFLTGLLGVLPRLAAGAGAGRLSRNGGANRARHGDGMPDFAGQPGRGRAV